jgi:tetratricopeptide (TPR) repeat protein
LYGIYSLALIVSGFLTIFTDYGVSQALTRAIPYAIVLESKTISSYIAPGWSILTEIIPMPKEASPEVLVNMGVEMAKEGYHSLALTCYRKAIGMKPDLKEAYNNIGKLLTETG